jgi:GNAT superfamily N-acetyltransferase
MTKESDICIIRHLNNSEMPMYCSMTFPAYRHLFNMPGIYGTAAFSGLSCLGLAAAYALLPGEHEIISIFVNKKYRNRGIARALLDELFIYARAFIKGPCKFKIIYDDSIKYRPAVEKLFNRLRFSEAQPRCRVFRCDKKIGEMPWINRYALVPDNFKIIKWIDLPENLKSDLINEQKKSEIFPPELSPFRDEKILEPLNSLALVYENSIIGWSVTHRPFKDMIRYSCIFVKEAFRGTGLAVILLMNSINLHVNDPRAAAEIPKASFVVYYSNPIMMKMINKRMKKYALSISESLERNLFFTFE